MRLQGNSVSLPIDGTRVILTAGEHQIFAALFNARGRWLRNVDLLEAIYDDEVPLSVDSIFRNWVCRLRKKLRPTQFMIEHRWQTGDLYQPKSIVGGYRLTRHAITV